MLGLGLVALAAALVARALALPSRQVVTPAAPRIALEDAAIAERLAAAVRLPTISHQDAAAFPRADFERFHAWLLASYPRLHRGLERETISDLSLVYTWRGSDPSLAPVVLLAHQDVVPAESPERWAHPPFAGEIADGFVWGRGAIDDKGALVAICEAVEGLLARGFAPRRTVILGFGHDEEVGGESGAKQIAALFAARGIRPALVIDEGLAILTPGFLPGVTRAAALVGIAEKGSVTLEIVASAPGGHSSTPPRSTAAGALAEAIRALEADPFPGGVGGVTALSFDFLAPELPLLARVPLANRWLFAAPLGALASRNPAINALLRTTTAVTMLSGSPKENVLPTEAIATANFRILPGETAETVRERVAATVAAPDVEVRFKDPGRDPSPVSPVDGPAFGLIQRTIGEIFRDAIVTPGLVLGGTDSRHFAAVTPNVFRFAPFQYDASDLTRPHGIDERLSLANLADGVRWYARFVENASAAFEAP